MNSDHFCQSRFLHQYPTYLFYSLAKAGVHGLPTVGGPTRVIRCVLEEDKAGIQSAAVHVNLHETFVVFEVTSPVRLRIQVQRVVLAVGLALQTITVVTVFHLCARRDEEFLNVASV